MNIPRTIIFIGPQGSGKGTQAKLLAQKSKGIYVGTGSLFRKIAKENTEFGRYIKDLINQGLLASDHDVERVLDENISEMNKEQSIIFDGVPRRLSQAEFLINYMHVAGKKDIATFYINLPQEEAVRRMSLRRVCSQCETPTTITENTQTICLNCGGELVQRADDMPDAIARRLDIYNRDTIPVLDYLREHSDFHEIDGGKTIAEVQSEIDKILGVTN
ncbi:MAG: adenylate kinase [Candidatus Doudnabacteria bacterium]